MEDHQYKGIKKHFNSYTIRGRSNWGKLMIGIYVLTYITYKAIRKLTEKKPLVKRTPTQSEDVPDPSGNEIFSPAVSPACTEPNTQYPPHCPYGGTPPPQQPFYCHPPCCCHYCPPPPVASSQQGQVQHPHKCPQYAQPNSEYASPDCQKED